MPPRVLVTRAPHQVSELASLLREAGMEPVMIPTIDLAAPLDTYTLPASVAQLERYDWLVFTSANAAEAFAKVVADTSTPAREAAPKIAAIGPATARTLIRLGFRADLVPPQAVAESFAETLLLHARQPDGKPTRFLLIRAEQARDHLPETLRAAGAEVTIAPAYRNVVPAGSVDALRELFRTPETYPAAVTFTSSSTASNLLDLLRSAGLTLPPEVIRASIGPITTRTLVEADLPPDVEAEEATVASLVRALQRKL